ncbi:hypothetical protein ACJJTC_003481 [Scirpophaga incertulas]
MDWIFIAFSMALSTTTAYRYVGSQYDDSTYYDYSSYKRSDRVRDRSIPIRSFNQRVQIQDRPEYISDDPRARNDNLSHMSANLQLSNRRGDDSGAVVFPGPTNVLPSFIPVIPPECTGQTLCEEIPNYPSEYVNQLIANTTDKQRFRNIDIDIPEISQRRGPGEDSKDLCTSRDMSITPKAGRSPDGSWMTIINTKPAVQRFNVKVCNNPRGSCSSLMTVPETYNATCRQHTTYRSMWALNESGQAVIKPFLLPSCCICQLKLINPDK